MQNLCIQIFLSIVILNSNNSSSQFDCLPNGEPILTVARSEAPDSHTRNSLERTHPAADTSFSARSTSPPARRFSSSILKFPLNQLKFIRLISHNNPRRVLGIRRNIFPPNKSLKLTGARGVSVLIPSEERIVLTTSSGDVLAILEHNNTILRGIYKRIGGVAKRVKFNTKSDTLSTLNRNELDEIPAGNHMPIFKNFRVFHVDEM